MELVVMGGNRHIATDWSDSLGGLTISHTQQGETVMSGTVREPARALRRLLDRIDGVGCRLW